MPPAQSTHPMHDSLAASPRCSSQHASVVPPVCLYLSPVKWLCGPPMRANLPWCEVVLVKNEEGSIAYKLTNGSYTRRRLNVSSLTSTPCLLKTHVCPSF